MEKHTQVASNYERDICLGEAAWKNPIPFHGALHTPLSSENLLSFSRQGGDHFQCFSEVNRFMSLNCLRTPWNSIALIT